MKRRRFAVLVGATVASAGAAAYLFSDRHNLLRTDFPPAEGKSIPLTPEEEHILYLAALAPSGHNAQPWFVQHLAPYHWIIGNDSRRWLPAVDPQQRETILSIGAFLQNLEYAAEASGYRCRWTPLARTNQDNRVIEVALSKDFAIAPFDVEKIKSRRTTRTGFSPEPLKADDLTFLLAGESEYIHYLPGAAPEARSINELTIEANRLQSYRDPAQQELAEWIRFSSRDARKYRDGLTTGGMEIAGLAGWMVRNFYNQSSVLKTDFRERGIAQVRAEVSASAGWIIISSTGDSVSALLDAGRRLQRLFLKVRDRHISLHPMTQILEEASTRQLLQPAIGIGPNIQFILRVSYIASYPPPVSLRRPVSWFVHFPTAV